MSPYPFLIGWLLLYKISIEIRIHNNHGINMLSGNEKTAQSGGFVGNKYVIYLRIFTHTDSIKIRYLFL